VASNAKPYEKIAVAQNLKYVIEVLRAEGLLLVCGRSDEAALVMDGQVEVYLIKPVERQVPAGTKERCVWLGLRWRRDGWVGAGAPHGAAAEGSLISSGRRRPE